MTVTATMEPVTPEQFRRGMCQLAAGVTIITTAPTGSRPDCIVAETVPTATHTIFIGRVVDLRIEEAGVPLLYCSGRFGVMANPPCPAGA